MKIRPNQSPTPPPDPGQTDGAPAKQGSENPPTQETPSGTGAGTGDAPAKSGDAPAKSGDAPAKSGDAPAKSGDAPAKSGDAPAKSGDAPAKAGDASTKTADKAAGRAGKPGVNAADAAKTAEGVSKANRSGAKKILQRKGPAPAGAVRRGPNAGAMMRSVLNRVGRVAERVLMRIERRITRVEIIMQRHHELVYLTTSTYVEDRAHEEEIKKAALRLQALKASGPPALSKLMDRVSDLNEESSSQEWADKIQESRDLVEQAGSQLEEINRLLVAELQTVSDAVSQTEEMRGVISQKFSDAADRIIGNI